ncbi:MAG: hypothetical protein QME42_00535 [bacterium]|nr:hypothetical protein [bacterium]
MYKTFIINEWLWADLNDDNGSKKQKESIYFLETLWERCDKIAVGKGSKFQQKEWEFSGNATDTIKRLIAKLYFGKIKLNSLKYEEVDIEGCKEIDLEGMNPDDFYLVKTYYKTKAPIITTDNKLVNILQSENIPCKLRDIFLEEYEKETDTTTSYNTA